MLLASFLLLLQAGGGDLSPALHSLIDGRGAMSDPQFIERVTMLADGGDASAAEMLGELHRSGGFGMARDLPKACDWHERAAKERGDAAHNLALCFETGEGRTRDPARARLLYARADALGWIQARCALGTMLVHGRGGAADPAKGGALCRAAAEAGNANAQSDYAIFLLMGQLGPKDAVGARRWFTAAAEQGQANAAFLLGQMYWKGDGAPVDRAAAARWWKVAWDNGRKDAAALLSREVFNRMVPDGKTVDRSLLPEYLRWLRAAATEDPDPAERAKYAGILATLEGAD
jgi:TPR repeat protein